MGRRGGGEEMERQNKIQTILHLYFKFISEKLSLSEKCPLQFNRDTFLESSKLLCQSPQPWYHWTGSHTPKPALHYTCGPSDLSELLLCSAWSCSTKAYRGHRLRVRVVTHILLFPKSKALNYRGCLHDFAAFGMLPWLFDLFCLGGCQNQICSGMIIHNIITYYSYMIW